VSRFTVREALRQLRAGGLLERFRGRGTFLSAQTAIEQPIRGGFYSLARTIAERGLVERSTVLTADLCRDAEAAARLGEPPEAELVLVERVRFAGDEPLAWDRSFFPRDVAEQLLTEDLSRGSLYDKLGVRVSGGRERIQATMPDSRTRKVLRLPAGAAVLAIERLALAGDRPIEWRTSLVRGDRYAFVAEW
jgi:GntR family transcriptional regulator